MTENRNSGEYRYSLPSVPRPCTTHPGCLIIRCRRFLCNRTLPVLNQPGQPRPFAHPHAVSPDTETPLTNTRLHAAASLTPHAVTAMLTNAAKWSLGHGNAPVPSRWRATH
jgi:hypothetical protein